MVRSINVLYNPIIATLEINSMQCQEKTSGLYISLESYSNIVSFAINSILFFCRQADISIALRLGHAIDLLIDALRCCLARRGILKDIVKGNMCAIIYTNYRCVKTRAM